MITYELPTFYDSVNLVIRTMDSTAFLPPAQMPISAQPGNVVQSLSDGLYVGSQLALPAAIYINTVTGVNAPGNGTLAVPYQTIDYALAQLTAASVNMQLQTSTVIVLQAGQTFPVVNDINLYGGTLTFAFYGDPNYGAYNSPPVGTGADPAIMTNLQRPIIQPATSLVNNYYRMAGINVYGGNVSLQGVTIELPMAPAGPSISLYSNAADFVRPMDYASPGYLDLQGAIINMQDITAFWGILGINPRVSKFNLIQYASQFQVAGALMDLANAPTTAQLAAIQYFIKFYPDYIGNNQQQGVLYNTATTATPASGLVTVTWADVQSFTIENGIDTNLASFPIAYDLTYGLRKYIYGITYDALDRPVNVISSRTI
jgi:hypothetical protein